MRELLHVFFPPGSWAVGGNLLASMLWTIPVMLGGLWHHRRIIHGELGKLSEEMRKELRGLRQDARSSLRDEATAGSQPAEPESSDRLGQPR
jgi:hypothetical protein